MNKLRIGCVPYLNAKPLIDWFHTETCDSTAEIQYVVPSELARLLEDGSVDVALVSIFEMFRRPDLALIPNISISADGAVKSVRLFSCRPFEQVRTVALDTSSLTSAAMTRILLKEQFGVEPSFESRPPDLDAMLSECDAGLIIGDLQLFDTPASYILDLGAAWKEQTGLPFVYAAWLARPGAPIEELTNALSKARDWGVERLGQLATRWSAEMNLPLDRVADYFINVMQYDLGPDKLKGLTLFESKCRSHGLI